MIRRWLLALSAALCAIPLGTSDARAQDEIPYAAQGFAMAGLTPWRSQWFGASISGGASLTSVDLFTRISPSLDAVTPWIAPLFGPGVVGVGPASFTAQLTATPGLPPAQIDGASTRSPAELSLYLFSGGNVAGFWRNDPIWGVGPGWLAHTGGGGDLWAVRDKRGAVGLSRRSHLHLGGGGFAYLRVDEVLLIAVSGGIVPAALAIDPSALTTLGDYGDAGDGELQIVNAVLGDARLQAGPVGVFYNFERSNLSDPAGEAFARDTHRLGVGFGAVAERR